MPRYRYQAVDQRGKKVKGQMEAEDEAGLYGALREEGKYLVKAKADKAKRGRTPLAAEVHFHGNWGRFLWQAFR